MNDALPGTMQAAHFSGGGKVELNERAVPKPGAGQLLIRVAANALCGSERGQFYNGASVTPGHETAGTVVAAGPETHTRVGTPGVVYLMDYCGACKNCRQGATQQCLNKRGDFGFNRDGGYAPFALLSETALCPLPDDVPLEEATLLLDIMGTGGHAVDRAALLQREPETLLVAGAGPVGLGVAAMARIILGDLRILISDFAPYRLELAEQLGAEPVDLRRGALASLLQRRGVRSVDVAIDTSGKAAARRDCLDALGKRGVLVCAGHGEGLSLDVSADLIAPERAVLGTEYFPVGDIPKNLERFRTHQDLLAPIITHRYELAGLTEAFETFFSGNTGKVLVTP